MVSRRTKSFVKQGVTGGALIWIVLLVIHHQTKVRSPDGGGQEDLVRLRGIKNSQAGGEHIYNSIDTNSIGDERMMEIISPTEGGGENAELSSLRDKIYSSPRSSDEKYAINETKSQDISLTRDIPDTRPDDCVNIEYDITSLPTISVIIPMYNEAPSILLRTVHSFLSRTPPSLLADIIIVDDMSTNENMKQVLTDYVDKLPSVVRVLRLKKKAHLIKARMAGASVARGDVLYFQDGHTEVNVGWAEPMLSYIKAHPKTIVQPAVDTIDQWSIEYEQRSHYTTDDMWRGVFLWDMRYAWHKTPEKYKFWRSSQAEPYPCPILVGCSIAVDKKYFTDIGGFDTGLDIWGGEQIELSFRAWMCGGRVVIHPCARSGHIFKPWMKGDVNWKQREVAIAKNNIRIGESWMERYTSYYYAANRIYDFKWVDLNEEEKAGVLERRKLKKDLKCENFDWYLDNVLPELKKPPTDARFYGEVGNDKSKMCLTVHDDRYVGLTLDCWMYSRLQEQAEFTFRDDGLMMYGPYCVIVNKANLLQLVVCSEVPHDHGTVTFELQGRGQTTGVIRYRQAGYEDRCLEQVTNIMETHYREQMPQFGACNSDNRFQYWLVNYHFEYKFVPEPLFPGDVRFSNHSTS